MKTQTISLYQANALIQRADLALNEAHRAYERAELALAQAREARQQVSDLRDLVRTVVHELVEGNSDD